MGDEMEDNAGAEGALLRRVTAAMGTVIVGQHGLIERILIALLTNGHLLIEGVPGLAKTKVVKSLAQLIDARFQRIQFTPDLLPADLVGTLIYDPREGRFTPRKGPIFANIVLADEINRAPAKVHSALLEAMEERQVTIGETSFLLALAPHPAGLLAGLVLLAAIVAYDLRHKGNPWSVLIMAACRLLVFVVVALALTGALPAPALVGGGVQFAWGVAISLIARHEHTRAVPFAFPVVPAMLAGICLLDGVVMALYASPAWLAAGATGALLTWAAQRYVRGD